MDFGLSDEQRQLKETARDFLRNECPATIVRKVMADADGIPRELYREIAKLGWTGLTVPEKYGGAGMTTLDMAVLLEECGYAAMPGPFLFSSAIAAPALASGGSEELNSRWLPALVEGRAIGTIAIVDENDSLEPRDIAATAAETGSGFTLLGVKMFVPYAHLADFIIVAARIGGSYGGESVLFVVETATPGVTRQNHEVPRPDAPDRARRV